MQIQTGTHRYPNDQNSRFRTDESAVRCTNRATMTENITTANTNAEHNALPQSFNTGTQNAAIYLLKQRLQVEFHNRVNIFENSVPLFVMDSSATLRFLDSEIESAIHHGIKQTLDGNKNWNFLFNAHSNHRACYQFSLHLADNHHVADNSHHSDHNHLLDHEGRTVYSTRTAYENTSPSAKHPLLILIARKLDRSKDRLVEVAAAHWGLSATEKRVLSLIIDGISNKEIARQRQVSPETVKRQSVSILSKSGCDNRTMLASHVFYYLEKQLSGEKPDREKLPLAQPGKSRVIAR